MNCNCEQNAVVIVRNNDTDWNGGKLATINLVTDILDLSTFTATLNMAGIIKTFDDLSSGSIEVNLSASETKNLPPFFNGVLNLIDSTGKVATIESLIPFKVISIVHGNAIATEPYTLNFDVKQGGETILTVNVESAVSVEVGMTTTLNPDEEAYVRNVGTGNHLVLDFGIPQGVQGVQGETGADGKDGKDGIDGQSAIITGVTASVDNSVGTPSVTVISGGTEFARSFDFEFKNLKGEQGETGAPGTDGKDGKDGKDGQDGAAATIAVGTTTTGEPGTDSSVTNSGTSSAAVLNFVIPKGETGAAGADGQDGQDGADGEAATITVGTTTTGQPGTNASVTNSGTSSAAVLDFVIPQGATGAAGADGEGVPTGGTQGQVLAKVSSTDYDTEWITPEAGVTVDDALSTSSVNPVQNKVITKAINGKQDVLTPVAPVDISQVTESLIHRYTVSGDTATPQSPIGSSPNIFDYYSNLGFEFNNQSFVPTSFSDWCTQGANIASWFDIPVDFSTDLTAGQTFTIRLSGGSNNKFCCILCDGSNNPKYAVLCFTDYLYAYYVGSVSETSAGKVIYSTSRQRGNWSGAAFTSSEYAEISFVNQTSSLQIPVEWVQNNYKRTGNATISLSGSAVADLAEVKKIRVFTSSYVNLSTTTTSTDWTLADSTVIYNNISVIYDNTTIKKNQLGQLYADVDSLPSQTGNSGKFLTTDGTDASWATIQTGGANTDINNLSTLGNSRLQYAPFSINAGTVTNGENATLSYSGSTLTCAPCTITTCDSRTLVDANSATYDVSNEADGTYYVFKDYETGALSLSDELYISDTQASTAWTQPVLDADGTPGGEVSISEIAITATQQLPALWLDTSTVPNNLKVYSSGSYSVNNDLVYIGDCTVLSGAVSSITNRDFGKQIDTNDLVEVPVVTETYKSGTSWYRLYSDGWCVQGGRITGTTVTFLRTFVDTNFHIVVSYGVRGSSGAYGYDHPATLSASQFTVGSDVYSSNAGFWRAEGFVS